MMYRNLVRRVLIAVIGTKPVTGTDVKEFMHGVLILGGYVAALVAILFLFGGQPK
jgi:hypothetical protein